MPAFPVLETESKVQVSDKTRLDATKTYIVGATISLVEIEPEALAGFNTVTTNKYLDWGYSTSGSKTVTLRVTDSLSNVTTTTATIEVLTAAEDKLFSTDQDLKLHESDILKYIPPGRSSYLNLHRQAQTIILETLDRRGFTDINGNKYTVDSVTDLTEVKEWSRYETLRLIFDSLWNNENDLYYAKARHYEKLASQAKERQILRLDQDGDGETSLGEGARLTVIKLERR